MTHETGSSRRNPEWGEARDWVKILAKYREPSAFQSWFEVAVTLGPFIALWALAWWALAFSGWLTIAISVVNAGFLLRLFAIQHDCGHGAFFQSRTVSDWVGRCLGVLTLTPYDVWRHSHQIHHNGSGNLARRGIGDINTLTVAEYRALTPLGRLGYRMYRHPIVLFAIGPIYHFFLENRLPLGYTEKAKFWVSAMGTNAAILVLLGLVIYFGGILPVLLIFLPSTILAATAGVWLFYVQHQFEHAHWDEDEEWDIHDAALRGSSHYVMPPVLQWMTANIGIHHIHHLYSRIPFYRLPEVLKDHTVLAEGNRLTIWESFENARLHLWDENSRRLLSFREARAVA